MRRWLPLALPLVLICTACQSLAPRRSPAGGRADELGRLKQRVLELEQQARMNEVEISRLRQQVAELSQLLDERSPARPGRSGAAARPPAPPVSPRPIPAPSPPAERLEAEDLDSAPAGPRSASPAPPAQPIDGDGQALYDRAYTLYHQGRHVDAESAFQGFLQRYASTDLADNAQFWIGEARLRRGDVSGALAAFRETVTRFPRGNKVPDALFRSGDCLERLGDVDGARAAWRQTIERYPNSAAAALSEERLRSDS